MITAQHNYGGKKWQKASKKTSHAQFVVHILNFSLDDMLGDVLFHIDKK